MTTEHVKLHVSRAPLSSDVDQWDRALPLTSYSSFGGIGVLALFIAPVVCSLVAILEWSLQNWKSGLGFAACALLCPALYYRDWKRRSTSETRVLSDRILVRLREKDTVTTTMIPLQKVMGVLKKQGQIVLGYKDDLDQEMGVLLKHVMPDKEEFESDWIEWNMWTPALQSTNAIIVMRAANQLLTLLVRSPHWYVESSWIKKVRELMASSSDSARMASLKALLSAAERKLPK